VESTNENHLGGKTDQKVIKDADVALDHVSGGTFYFNFTYYHINYKIQLKPLNLSQSLISLIEIYIRKSKLRP